MQLKNTKLTNDAEACGQGTKRFKNVSSTLALAAIGVLGAAQPALAERGASDSWDFDVAGLYYAEDDDRVMAVEPAFSATRNFSEGEALNLKLVLDSLTGASPNGATPSDQPQTFTTPSGNGNYTVSPNEAPLDDTFKDTRVALSANWSAPVNRDWAYSAGIYGSNEYDFFSLGLSGGLTRYLNQKNTELNFGLSVEQDTVDPVGGSPIGLSAMPQQGDTNRDASRDQSQDSKTIVDALFGVSQVINKNVIMQFNYGVSVADGYLNDPYKVLSVIDSKGDNVKDGSGNNVYLYDARPDSRVKHSFYWQTKQALDNGDVMDYSYRFMLDDWGVTSHTLEAAYQWHFASSYIEPFARYYMQGEADFYQRYVTDAEYNSGSPTLKEASSDYRLGELDAITVGAKYAWSMGDGDIANVRLAYYMQSSSGDAGPGKLASQELYPDTNALIMTFGYSF
jgi:hypothetical protein